MFSEKDIYVYIFSWKKVTVNAMNLYKALRKEFTNTIFINCDENYVIPVDVSGIQLDDSYYYGGQFETAITNIPSNKILGVFTGDVNPDADWSKMAENCIAAFNTEKIGVYAPDVYPTFHKSRNEFLWGSLYSVPNTDCTGWFIHHEIVAPLKDIPYFKISNYGWGIDNIFMKETRKKGKLVARDYGFKITQPVGTAYNQREAHKMMDALHIFYDNM